MRRWLSPVGAAVALALVGMLAPSPSGASACQAEPGMCNGRSDPNLLVTAHANGSGTAVPKYILNLSTNDRGEPRGVLVLGKGASRVQVTDWCRTWQHIPGQPGRGECSLNYPEGAITAHGVSLGRLRDGTRVLVRTDVRQTDEGRIFRVRYRPWPAAGHTTVEEEGCEDAGWTRVPTHGWYPLDRMSVRVLTTSR
jgi:hypothetical protein